MRRLTPRRNALLAARLETEPIIAGMNGAPTLAILLVQSILQNELQGRTLYVGRTWKDADAGSSLSVEPPAG